MSIIGYRNLQNKPFSGTFKTRMIIRNPRKLAFIQD